MKPLGIAPRVVIATVAVVLLAGTVFAVLIVAIASSRGAQHRALHSQDVLNAADNLELRVLDIENGQRGFLLTHQTDYLTTWEQAREALPHSGSALIDLVATEPQQVARARRIVVAARSYVDDYSVPLVTAAERNDPSARTIAATAEGEARVDTLRGQFSELIDAERRTSVAAARASDADAHRAYLVAVLGLAAATVLLVLYTAYVNRAIVLPIRRAARVADVLASGDLAARVPVDGVGEIGVLQRAFNGMAVSLQRGRDDLSALAEEQGALRRVATLVARGASSDDVLAAVAAEIGHLLPADQALIGRYDDDGMQFDIVGSFAEGAGRSSFERSVPVRKGSVAEIVWNTRRAGRVELDERFVGLESSAGVPIVVEGRLWGVVIAAFRRADAMPVDTEIRLGRFTELVSTAISDAESQAALTASRARLVTSADDARRRIERDLHDGAQQQLIKLAVQLRSISSKVPPELGQLATELDGVVTGLRSALDELRELASGIHPPVLSQGGLIPALKELARRSTVPVHLDVHIDERAPEAVEVAAYYVVSEALANAAKHARALSVNVEAEARDGKLAIAVRDDGVGGADFAKGSGLVGLRDRVEALGGHIALQSKAWVGTTLAIELPLTEQVATSS